MERELLAIQQSYPQVWHACHVRHQSRRNSPFRLSERDHAILAHIGPGFAQAARDLARHLGVGAPTMSEALARLERRGFVARGPRPGRTATRRLELTELGKQAVQSSSVLDTERLRLLLERLTAGERRRAAAGLQLLARAAHAAHAAHTAYRSTKRRQSS